MRDSVCFSCYCSPLHNNNFDKLKRNIDFSFSKLSSRNHKTKCNSRELILHFFITTFVITFAEWLGKKESCEKDIILKYVGINKKHRYVSNYKRICLLSKMYNIINVYFLYSHLQIIVKK